MSIDKHQFLIPGHLHAIESIASQPKTVLTHWQLIKVRDHLGQFSRHLTGRADGEGRASSKVISLDVIQLLAITRSGRIYVLDRPGRDSDAAWTFAEWLRINQCTAHADLTRALLRLRAKKMNQA